MSRDGGEPITVLHVDDEPDFADLVATFLERSHEAISVVTATSAGEGLDRLASTPVDCIVSDHDMPDMDGLEFLRAVRASYPELPFVLYTGKGNEEIASDAISAGVTEYLQKSSGTEQYAVLANRIERAVEEYRAKSALEESERMSSTLISNLPGMAYRCRNERGWPMEFVSEGAKELTGYDPEELQSGDAVWGEDVLHPDECDSIWDSVQAALEAREPFEVTYRIVTADGEEKRVWEQGRGIYEGNELVSLEGIILDIAEIQSFNRRTPDRSDELDRYRTLVENVGDPMYVLDTDATIEVANQAMAEHLGYDREEIVGAHASKFMPESDVETGSRIIRELLDDDRTWATFEIETIHADDSRSINEDKIAVLTDENGTYEGSVGVLRNITARKQRERDLRRYETIIQAVGDPVYALDTNGDFTFVNEAVGDIGGYEPTELIGEHVTTVVSQEGYEISMEHVRRLRQNENLSYATFEVDIVTRDGRHIPTENHLALLSSEDDEFRGIAGVIRDISERKRRENRLEEFTSVVSHDLQSPLNVIAGRAELAVETGDLEHVEAIAAAADRMDGLITDLLTLAHEGRTVGDTEPTELSAVARDAWEQVQAPAGELVVTDQHRIEADTERLRELLVNLFRNAVEHGSKPGERGLVVDIGRLDGRSGFYVADDGPGIPPDQRESVFEHGHTTSESGTGLGLSIVQNIAQAHGWTVRVTESDAGGARFEFVID